MGVVGRSRGFAPATSSKPCGFLLRQGAPLNSRPVMRHGMLGGIRNALATKDQQLRAKRSGLNYLYLLFRNTLN
jgi:hypothetical protein